MYLSDLIGALWMSDLMGAIGMVVGFLALKKTLMYIQDILS